MFTTASRHGFSCVLATFFSYVLARPTCGIRSIGLGELLLVGIAGWA